MHKIKINKKNQCTKVENGTLCLKKTFHRLLIIKVETIFKMLSRVLSQFYS